MYLPTPHCNLQVIWFCSVMIRSSHDIIKPAIFNFHCSYLNVKCHSTIRDIIKKQGQNYFDTFKLVELKQLDRKCLLKVSYVCESKLSKLLSKKIVKKTVKKSKSQNSRNLSSNNLPKSLPWLRIKNQSTSSMLIQVVFSKLSFNLT